MITNPDFFLSGFSEAGSDWLLVHRKGNHNLSRTVQAIKALGKRAGVVINPATPASVLEEILPDIDQVMTVNPGFGNQKFLHATLPEIRRLRDDRPGQSYMRPGSRWGINATTAPLVLEAGANVLVAGSAIFNDRENVATAMKHLRDSINQTGNQ